MPAGSYPPLWCNALGRGWEGGAVRVIPLFTAAPPEGTGDPLRVFLRYCSFNIEGVGRKSATLTWSMRAVLAVFRYVRTTLFVIHTPGTYIIW